MKVILSKHAGFCMGVKRAVETAKNEGGEGVYILGEIIHNESVLADIEKTKTKIIYSPDEIDSGKIIIRSHGVSKEVLQKLKDKNIEIVNCTCPFVCKIQKIVDEYYNKNYQIVIIGKSDHPEVIGINGWCNNSAIILDSETIPNELLNADKICVVSQTTYSVEKFRKILKKITDFALKTVEVFETICYTTMERQLEAENLSKTCDAIIVLGGLDSSNTNKLYEICKSNCKNTYRISKPNELDYKNFNKHFKSVGIVCGASTPFEQSMEVFLNMEEMKEVNSMEQALEMLDEKQNLKKGQKISVVISQVNDDGLKVYFDGKTDITLLKEELAVENYDKNAYKIGDEIDVIVMGKNPLKISQKQILVLEKEQELVNELNDGKIINVQITASNKGGIVGKYNNFDVFVPAKEIKIGYVSDLNKYVGKTLRVKPIKVEYTPRKKEIIASQRVILEAEKKQREAEKLAKEEAFFSSISENDIVTGTVVRFAQFGAFVVVNGFDCLAHISDLSWTNVKKASDVLELNKSYDFVVLKIDKENKKVSIGYKQLQPKPWDLVGEKYAVGDVIKGKIVRIVDFGAFVEIEKGVDGLVHVSQISHEFLENPASILKVGQEIDAKILAIAPEKEKINLSIKALIEAPKKEEVEEDKTKKEKKVKKENDEDLHSWTESSTSEISIADLLNK